MKGNKGITLIALIVTIIVLIILAGVAIAMIAGDNGIINNATKAKIDTQIATVDEKVKLARTNMMANILSRSNQISTDDKGYIATRQTEFDELVTDLRKELGLDVSPVKDTTINKEKFSVSYYDPGKASKGLLEAGDDIDDEDREAYIVITYTDNSLRSSLPKKTEVTGTTFTSAGVKFNLKGTYNPNGALLVYVIKVENYGCELCIPTLTTTSVLDTDGLDSDKIKSDYAKTTYNDSSSTPSPTEP